MTHGNLFGWPHSNGPLPVFFIRIACLLFRHLLKSAQNCARQAPRIFKLWYQGQLLRTIFVVAFFLYLGRWPAKSLPPQLLLKAHACHAQHGNIFGWRRSNALSPACFIQIACRLFLHLLQRRWAPHLLPRTLWNIPRASEPLGHNIGKATINWLS